MGILENAKKCQIGDCEIKFIYQIYDKKSFVFKFVCENHFKKFENNTRFNIKKVV